MPEGFDLEAQNTRNASGPFRSATGAIFAGSPPRAPPSLHVPAPKVKMSPALVALLVYTVGVKCRGLNKKEVYAPAHVFSLSENTANRMLKQSGMDLVKHNKTHLVRIYPKGTRIGSTNFEPHKFWAAGVQLVAINWQTFGKYKICPSSMSYILSSRYGVHD